jgi:CBS domain-containing protein
VTHPAFQTEVHMKVREVMSTKVNMASPDDTIERAAQLLEASDCGALPVSENDRLVGMVTDRDITVRGIAKGKQPGSCTVREVMSTGVKYVFDDESTESAAENMSRLQVRRLPVLNRGKRLVGIVALADLAVKHDGAAADVALKGVSQPSSSRPV